MKKHLLLFGFFFYSLSLIAQESIFVNYERTAEFPGGDAVLMSFIRKNTNTFLLNDTIQKQLGGLKKKRVICSFSIDTLGGVRDAQVLRSLHPVLDAEALRVVNLIPAIWKPAMSYHQSPQGKKMAIRYTVPVFFEETVLCDSINKNEIDKMPEYKLGFDSLFTYISSGSDKYAPSPKVIYTCQHGIPGRTLCSFIVDKTGQISNIKVVRSVDPFLDKIALLVISELKDFIPAEYQGEKVCYRLTVPVGFRKF